MFFLKILEEFVLKTLFSKDEYKITSKNFNPLKVILILILLVSSFFCYYLLFRCDQIFSVIEKENPALLEKLLKQ